MNHPVPLNPPEMDVTASELSSILDAALEKLSGLGVGMQGHRARLAELGGRLREERFHLAVLGQFKRGKSTLLNALLGEKLLPTAVVPVTALPAFLCAGDERRLRVELDEHRAAIVAEGAAVGPVLSKFATEEGNPENRLGASQLEVFHPADLLRAGVVLIDTPGIGSTHLHNTEATLEFLPRCDAALFLTSVDPPLTRVELEFLKEARSKLARLFFVMNKIDTVSDADRSDALRFFENLLREELGEDEEVKVFGVSARDGLEAKLANDAESWERSGMGAVERHLLGFLANEKRTTLERAVAKKATDVLASVLLEVRLAVRSLELPAETLAERRGLLEETFDEARRQQSLAGDLLAGDEKRLTELLEAKAEEWRREARERFEEILREALAEEGSDGAPDHPSMERVLSDRLPPFFEGMLGKATRDFERRFGELVEPHQRRLRELVETVRRGAAEIFDVPYRPQSRSLAFEVKREPFWSTHKWRTSLSPVPEGLFDRFLPEGVRRRRLEARFVSKIDSLVVENVESLRWTLLQEIGGSFRRFRRELEEGLAVTIAATRGAIEAAAARRREHSETVAQEVARLSRVLEEIEALETRLRGADR